METPAAFGRLPAELLQHIMKTSAHPFQTYLQLLSLSHGTRLGIRGTPRELSFDGDLTMCRDALRPTADVLAALLGPCKRLVKLSFSASGTLFRPQFYGCGRTEASSAGWVDAAFGGLDRLAVLEYLPTTCEPAIERILSRLPGLLELRLNSGIQLSAHLLSAIARCCPGLRSLRCDSIRPTELGDIAALAPLLRSLQQFRIPSALPSTQLATFVGGLSAVSTLHIGRCAPGALEPLGANLSRLSLDMDGCEENLPGPGLSRLERLTVRGFLAWSGSLARLLAANQATLQHLKLEIAKPNEHGLGLLMGTLGAMPQLTHLKLTCFMLARDTDLVSALPPGLLDRLVALTLGLTHPDRAHAPPRLDITSSRLQRLDLQELGYLGALALDCPALAELLLPAIPTDRLTLACPRLRLIDQLPAWFRDLSPMPDLESLSCASSEEPAWLPALLAGRPRLRNLTGVRLAPDLVPRLAVACDALAELVIELNVTKCPDIQPLILRLPGHLEFVHLSLARPPSTTPFELHVEAAAPGLRRLIVADPIPGLRLRLNCPSLARLSLSVDEFGGGSQTTSHGGDDLATTIELTDHHHHKTTLRSLMIAGPCAAASLLDLLTCHGSRLHYLGLRSPLAPSIWPQLAPALSMLPRLISLDLDANSAPSPLSLACPQLRTLFLRGVNKEQRVRLACPLLEGLGGMRDLGRLELVVPAPNLAPPIGSVVI
ncbi:hypothetical protein PAPYR_8985 [Paratrimastix pyriformis]|uniref:Uncharacterized protein n=1 Tax=Paratrimastix pyriformis TaxID=342808 RepID=A0ABQ8UC15_9EUKA|nr:hypothetical protein PAPYR_8985 [Paratrimastix pyriformis]